MTPSESGGLLVAQKGTRRAFEVPRHPANTVYNRCWEWDQKEIMLPPYAIR